MSDAIVRVEALQLHFDAGKIKALDGIDIAFGDGEFVALVGPSGCGKSSLLNVIGTLDSPTAGQVWFRSRAYAAFGDPLAEDPACAYVPAGYDGHATRPRVHLA